LNQRCWWFLIRLVELLRINRLILRNFKL
jgi:hypothetical protein